MLLKNFLHNTPQVKNTNINFHDLYYTVIKNRNENGVVNDKHGNNENDSTNVNDIITPNHYIGRKDVKERIK